MIRIKKIYIEEKELKTRCVCETCLGDEKRDIWFEVDKKYGEYLCYERADAYVVGLLSFAMRNGHDIVSEIPVTEGLLYQVQEE